MVNKADLQLEDCGFIFCRIEPPLDALRQLQLAEGTRLPRVKGIATNEEVEGFLRHLRASRVQRVVQRLIPTFPADKKADANEVVESGRDAFYFVDPQVVHQLPARHPFLVEHDFSPRRAGSSRTSSIPQQPLLMPRSRSGAVTHSNTAASSIRPLFPLQAQQPLDTHRSGLPRDSVTLRAENSGGTVRCCYNGVTRSAAVGLLPVDMPGVPTWQEILSEYNLERQLPFGREPKFGANADQADIIARHQFAFLFGPLHAARNTGHADELTKERIVAEYMTLWEDTVQPHMFQRRNYRVSVGLRYEGKPTVMLWPREKGRNARRAFNATFENESDANQLSLVLSAMLKDPAWDACSVDVVWEAWKEFVVVETLVQDRGKVHRSDSLTGLPEAIRQRIYVKSCCAPGLVDLGCYRDGQGQMCINLSIGGAIVRLLQEEYVISPPDYNLNFAHELTAQQPCSNMMTGATCLDHWMLQRAFKRACPYSENFRSESQDGRFVSTQTLPQTAVPQVDTVLSAFWTTESAAVFLIFLSCRDDAVSDQCAQTLGLLPDWCPVAALPSGPQMLSPRVMQALDRTDVATSSTATLDRIWAYQILDGGKIGAHCVENVRIIDWSRNHARGRTHSAKQADLLEVAVVANNAIRYALGDETADAILAEVAALLATTVEDPAWKQGINSRTTDYQWARANRQAIRLAREQDGYSLEGYPRSSLNGLRDATSARSKLLLTELGDADEAQQSQDEGEDEVSEDESQDDNEEESRDQEAQGDDHADGEERRADTGTHGERRSRHVEACDGISHGLRHYDEAQIAGIAAVAEEIEASLGRRLPRQAGQRLPRLWFFPEAWTDSHYLSYAADADWDADYCDETDQCPLPPQQDASSPASTSTATLNQVVRRGRSAGTLFLAWLRLELLGLLRYCRLTGLEMSFRGLTSTFHPLRASRVAHRVHGFPLCYGFLNPLPTSLAQFDIRLFNISVETWFANKWLKSWRLPALGSMLARRTDWFLSTAAASTLGLTPLTDEQARRVREVCGARIRFRHEASLIHNSLSEGEQIARGRAAGFTARSGEVATAVVAEAAVAAEAVAAVDTVMVAQAAVAAEAAEGGQRDDLMEV